MATRRDQYGGLKRDVLSTRTKVIGCEDIDGRMRCRRRRLADVVSLALGGMNTPSSRKVFTLDMRRRDDAEGERRIIGSWRRAGFFCRFETRGDGCGCAVGTAGALGEPRDLRNVPAILRKAEKSYLAISTLVKTN